MSIGPEQLSSLVARYAGPLTLYARQWCDGAAGHSPDDVVQEAFVQLARQSVAPNDPPAWLYRTVRNGAISARRSWWRRRNREHSAAAARPDWFQSSDDARLDAVAAVEALKSIGAECREIVTAHLWGELNFQQIAELTGLSVSTAHRRYREALEQLRTRLEHPCMNQN